MFLSSTLRVLVSSALTSGVFLCASRARAEDSFSARESELISLVMQRGIPSQVSHDIRGISIKRQRSLARDGLEPTLGLFLREDNTILLSDAGDASLPKSDVEFMGILSHEAGHALAFSLFSGEELMQFAAEHGPWGELAKTAPPRVGLMDVVLRTPHRKINIDSSLFASSLGVPNRYALRGVHEWFAEMFSAWVLQRLAQQKLVRLRSTAFRPSLQFSESLERTIAARANRTIPLAQR